MLVWWEQSGPFMGNCGDPYALVLVGKIKSLNKPPGTSNPLLHMQESIIEIEQVLFSKKLENSSITLKSILN